MTHTRSRRTGPGWTRAQTQQYARLGDRIVVEGPTVGVVRRDGEVVGLHHDDGSPPYDVRWSETGRITLFFPGPDAHIRRL
ncbi:DNA-binding protein [Streptomyces peucetius subsp. caesius ATCC 27952]|nr:DNA-binding protein [Streptomyces peucetius subsp. caesius ATCC 27952]